MDNAYDDMKTTMVLLEWEDSRQPTRGWTRVNELGQQSACHCYSVGFLVEDNDKVKVLAASVADVDDDKQAMGMTVIPTACVLRMTRLTSSSRAASTRKPLRT